MSVGHRQSLLRYHRSVLRLEGRASEGGWRLLSAKDGEAARAMGSGESEEEFRAATEVAAAAEAAAAALRQLQQPGQARY